MDIKEKLIKKVRDIKIKTAIASSSKSDLDSCGQYLDFLEKTPVNDPQETARYYKSFAPKLADEEYEIVKSMYSPEEFRKIFNDKIQKKLFANTVAQKIKERIEKDYYSKSIESCGSLSSKLGPLYGDAMNLYMYGEKKVNTGGARRKVRAVKPAAKKKPATKKKPSPKKKPSTKKK